MGYFKERSDIFNEAYENYLEADIFQFEDFLQYITVVYYESDPKLYQDLREEQNQRYMNRKWPYNRKLTIGTKAKDNINND